MSSFAVDERLNDTDVSIKRTSQEYYKMFIKARDFDIRRLDEYTIYMAYYEGKQNFIGAYTNKPWIVDVITPYASDAIDLRVSSLLASDYIGEIEPLSPEDVEAVRALNYAYKNLWKETKMDRHVSDSIYRAAILGDAFVHTVFDGGYIRGGTNRKNVGKIDAYFIDPASVFIDPSAFDIKDADYVFITERITPADVKALYPDFDFDKVRAGTSFQPRERGEIYAGSDYSSEQEYVLTKWTCYEIENKGRKNQKVYKTCLVEDQIVEDKKKLPIKYLPIAHLKWEKRIKSPYGTGLFSRILPLQKSINAVESAIVNTALSYAVPSYLVSTDSGVDPSDLARVAGAPGVVIPVEGNVDSAVRSLNQGSVVDEELVAIKLQIEQTIYKMVGVSPQFQGTFGSAGNTKGGAQEASNRSRIVEQKFFQNLQEYIEDLTEIFVDFIKNKYAGQTLYSRSGKTASGDFDFQATAIPERVKEVDFTFNVNLDIKTQSSKQLTKELMKELYQIERQYDAPIKLLNIKDILSNYDVPNQQELVNRYDDLARREDEKTAEIIAQLTTQAVQYNIDPAMLQQAIVEILEGKATPTVDQIMQMIEQTIIQRQQQADMQMMQQEQMGMPQPGMGMPQPGMGMEQPGMGMEQPGMGMEQPGMFDQAGLTGDEILNLEPESGETEQETPPEALEGATGDEILELQPE
jgi:hypothetical protein